MSSKRSGKRLNLSSQPNTRSMVLNRSSKMAGSKSGLRPGFGVFLARMFSLMLGVIPRLRMALRLCGQS